MRGREEGGREVGRMRGCGGGYYLFLWDPVYCEESVSLSKIEDFAGAGLLGDFDNGVELAFVIGLVVWLFAGDLTAVGDFGSEGLVRVGDLVTPERDY